MLWEETITYHPKLVINFNNLTPKKVLYKCFYGKFFYSEKTLNE